MLATAASLLLLAVVRRHRRHAAAAAVGDTLHTALLPPADAVTLRQQFLELPGAILLSPRLSWRWCVGVPIAIVFTNALYVTVDADTASNAYPALTFGNSTPAVMGSVLTIDLVHAVPDMYRSGAFLLASCTVFLSGLWPHARLLILLSCWVLPDMLLPSQRRRRLVGYARALGKLSLFAVIGYVLLAVSFRFHGGGSIGGGGAPDSAATVDVFFTAGWALYGFFFAVVVAQAVATVVQHLFRAATADPLYAVRAESDGAVLTVRRASLLSRWRGPAAVPVLALLALGGGAVLAAVGSTEDSFSITIRGLASLLIDGSPTSDLSAVDVATEITRRAWDADPGWWAIEVLFILLVFVVPAITALASAALVVCPLSPRGLLRGYVATETLYDFAAFDMYVLAMFVCSAQVQQYGSYVLSKKCSAVEPLIALFFGAELNGNAACFDLESRLLHGAWLMLAGAVLLWAGTAATLSMARTSLRARCIEPGGAGLN